MGHSRGNPRPLPYQSVLKQLLVYTPETGHLYWIRRTPHMFTSGKGRRTPANKCKAWNNQFAGQPAFTTLSDDGRHVGAVCGKKFLASRVIWKWMTGENPSGDVTHLDGNLSNDKWLNLSVRPVTP